MHSAALHLTPLLAEKSKTPFYIAGGVLVLWALFISLAVGMRVPSFPSNAIQQRAVMAVTILLVLFAISMAVVTSGGATSKASEAKRGSEAQPSSASNQTETKATPTTSTPSSSQPTATTGTPAPASSPAATSTSLKLAANPGGQLAFEPTSLKAKAGSVTIQLTNGSPLEHDVTIAQGSTVLGATPIFKGGTKSVTVTLKPGTYTFYCSVPGHRQAGMEGTLTVS